MKRTQWSTALLLLMAGLLSGCQTGLSLQERRLTEVRTARMTVAGQDLLFTSFGFLMFDPSIRQELLSAYDEHGVLNRSVLATSAAILEMSDEGNAVHLVIDDHNFPEIWLTDGWLLAHDPKFDEVLISMSNIGSRKGYRPPVIPLGL